MMEAFCPLIMEMEERQKNISGKQNKETDGRDENHRCEEKKQRNTRENYDWNHRYDKKEHKQKSEDVKVLM